MKFGIEDFFTKSRLSDSHALGVKMNFHPDYINAKFGVKLCLGAFHSMMMNEGDCLVYR